MTQILLKSWVWTFYRTYAGLFFILILFLFGFLSGREHIALALFFISVPHNLFYPAIFFILYGFFQMKFNFRILREKEYQYLGELVLLPVEQRFRILYLVVVILGGPVILYGLFLFVTALVSGYFYSAIFIISFVILQFLVISGILDYRILHPVEMSYWRLFTLPVPSFIRFSFFYLIYRHLFQGRTFSLILTKILTFILLIIFTILLPSVDYFGRYLNITILTVIVANSFISFEMNHLFFIRLTNLKNLPLKPLKMFINFFTVILLFISPELLYCLRNFHEYKSLIFISCAILAGVGFLLFSNVALLIYQSDQEKFIVRLFWLYLLAVLLLLFDLPALFLSIILILASFLIFRHYFYRFETVYKVK